MNFRTGSSGAVVHARSLLVLALLALCSTASATLHYVDVNTTNATPPYTNWSMAAGDIQSAIDASSAGDQVVVADGLYGMGGRAVVGLMTNRVVVDKPLMLSSLNGPTNTIILGWRVPGITNGDTAIRCVFLTNGAVLSGFTLANGATRGAGDSTNEQSGGAVWCASANVVVTNCLLIRNSATLQGGGAYQGRFNDCTFLGNSASYGGGAYSSALNNCTLTTNSASHGGGACYCTLTNCTLAGNPAPGNTGAGGGAFSSTLTSCTLSNNSTGCSGGGTCSATLFNCTLTGNSASGGGGAFGGTLSNCTLIGNAAWDSGGAADSATANNCTFVGNRVTGYWGGAANRCTLNNCVLSGNSAPYGGGASQSTLNNCTITNNSATGYDGGGIWGSTAYNCSISYNSAFYGGGGGIGGGAAYNCVITCNSALDGGGARGSTLNDCTIIGNSATLGQGGGACQGTLNNCIVYYNVGLYPSNYSGNSLKMNYCCTTPLPASGAANFTNGALFVDISSGDLRLQPNSPCINAGQNAYVSTATDLAGNPRLVGGTVDVGAYELQPPVLQVNPFGLLVVTNLPNLDLSLRQRGIHTFFFANRNDLLADGWSFWATKPNGGGGRNTEITNTANGAMVDYDQNLHLGMLWIPCDVGDLEASANNSRNSLFRTLPTNWISAQLRLSFVPTVNFQQAHLGLYQDDDNYLEVGIGFNSYRGGPNLSMAFEANGAPTVTLKTNLVTAALSDLRLDRDLGSGTITGWSSLDAINWTNLGSMTQWLANPRLLIWGGAAPSPWTTGQPTAGLSELDVVVSNSVPRVLTYALVNPPSGASIDTNGVITWTPTAAQAPGTYTLTSVVSDNWTPPWSVTNTFTVTVAPLPRLSVGTTGDSFVISWPGSLTNFVLESALDLSPSTLWTPVTNLPGSVAGKLSVSTPLTSGQQFFRLRQQGP